MRKIMLSTILLMLLCGMGLTGCNSRVNQENYNKIEMGMKYGEVVELLGEPDGCDSAMAANSCTWGNENRFIDVKFIGGQVVLFSSKGL